MIIWSPPSRVSARRRAAPRRLPRTEQPRDAAEESLLRRQRRARFGLGLTRRRRRDRAFAARRMLATRLALAGMRCGRCAVLAVGRRRRVQRFATFAAIAP